MPGNFTCRGGFRETVHYRQSVARALRGTYEIKDGVLLLGETNGRMGDGTFRVDGAIQLKGAKAPPHHIRISAQNVALRDASGLMELRAMALENTVDAEATLDWRQGLGDLEAEGTVEVHGLPASGSATEMRTPLDGTATFSFRNRAWYVRKASLASPASRIEVAGLDPDRSRIQIQLETSRPAEVLGLARGFSSTLESQIAAVPDLMLISGRYQLNGDLLMGLPDAIAYEGRITIAGGRWRAYSIESLSANAIWNGSRLALRTLKLRQGAQAADGDLLVRLPSGEAPPDVRFQGTLHQISLGTLRDFGFDTKVAVTGQLSGQGTIAYEQGRLRGEGTFQVEKASYNGQTVDILSAAVQIRDQVLHIAQGRIQRGPASVSLDGQIHLETGQMNLKTRLQQLPLTDIPEVKSSGIAINGRISAAGDIGGTAEQPEFSGTIRVEDLNFSGWDLGVGQATVNLREGVLSANPIDVQSALGGFRGEARISTGPGYPGRITLAFRDWNVQKIVADNVPELFNDFSTALHGNLVIEGQFADFAGLTYNGEMDGARFSINGYELRNDGMIRFTATTAGIVVAEARLVGEGSNLAIEKGGMIPLGSDPVLNLHLTGVLNLGFLDHMNPQVGVTGSASLNVSITGSRQTPQLIGQAVLQDVRLAYDDMPFPFSGLRGNIVFSRNSVRLEKVSGSIASGSIQVSGNLEHQGGELQGINLEATIQNARLRYPRDFISSVNAQLSLKGGSDARVLSGDVTVLRAEYLRDFSVLEQFIGRPTGGGGPQITNPLLAGTRLNVSVRSQDGLYIDNELARLRGKLDLELRGSLAYPSVTGRAETIEGSIFWRGNRFDVIRASADFVDQNRINPIFDVRAEADVRSYRLRLDLVGDLEHLTLNIGSDPPLSTVEIVSLLATGKSEQSGVADQRRLAENTGVSAASILSEELTGVIGKRVERIFGLKSFRVDPFLAGAENDPTARVTISERLSKDITVTFSRNLTTSQEQIIVLEYDVNRNLTIVATRDENGKYGVDFRFRSRFR